ncbi:MAG: hypothetical protein U0797_04745 [Gemmataceae bacterium]
MPHQQLRGGKALRLQPLPRQRPAAAAQRGGRGPAAGPQLRRRARPVAGQALPQAPPGPAVEGGSATFVPPSGDAPPPAPPPATAPPPASTPPPPPADPPASGLSQLDPLPRSSAPSADSSSAPDVRLGPPAPIRRDSASVPPDATKEPPLANVPGDRLPRGTDPDGKEMPQAIDLPGFAIAAPGVATGIKPFPDGIRWLSEHGYKTVLHLRAPGEDTTATRRLFESKGLKYVTVEGSPARMSKELYEGFVRQVKDADSHPLFVYDRDGSVTGGLWYLYNRVEKNEPDDKARAEAQRLGLRFDDDPEHQAMVLAAQKLLSELKP